MIVITIYNSIPFQRGTLNQGGSAIVVFDRKHSVMHKICIPMAETDGEGDCEVQFLLKSKDTINISPL